MDTTMDLLGKALERANTAAWTKKLELAQNSLYTAKIRGHLSPAIAGRLAEFLEEDVQKWIVIAALESEKDSACKKHLIKRLSRTVKSCF